jgi:hypothetical protein
MPANGFDEDEIFDCYSDALQVIEELMGKGVKTYKHGAVNADDPTSKKRFFSKWT